MNPKVKLILAVIAGVLIGGAVNMGFIMLGPQLLEYPEGIDFSDPENFAARAHLFTNANYAWAFIAHAMGTLVGGFVTAKIADVGKLKYALFIGAIFLIGGIKMVMDIPAPLWFVALDLLIAYIPMAYLGAILGGANKAK